MPSIQVNALTISITGATATVLTCTSTSNLAVGLRGWAVKSDDTGNAEVKVSAVLSGTTFLCQSVANANNSGGADLSAYNGGKIYFDTQIVEVRNNEGTILPNVIGYAPAAPTTGAHGLCEIVLNSTPSAGGIFGWECVVAGTPGTWKAISTIAA